MKLVMHEVVSQPYQDCCFSGGIVEGHPVDTIYLRIQRDGQEPTDILLRPDEVAALIYCLSGALWSDQMKRLMDEKAAA